MIKKLCYIINVFKFELLKILFVFIHFILFND